jgi:hypothetical protein
MSNDGYITMPAHSNNPSIYTPRCLSPLPRHRCAFIYLRHVTRYGSKIDFYVVPGPCTSKPLKNGWCATHQYCQAFLEQGAKIGYPRLRINEGLWLGAGICGWEAFAQYYAPKHTQEVAQAIKLWKEEGQFYAARE